MPPQPVPDAGNHVEVERGDVVARLVLNRPERRNALSHAVMDEMLAALDTVAADETARVLVIEARGPAFSAGHDLAEMTAHRDAAFFEALFATCVRLMTRVHELPQPVIAKVHGVATAAGCQLVAACDLAVAADDGTLRDPGRQHRAVLLDADGAGRAVDRPQARARDVVHGRDDRRGHRGRLGSRQPGRPRRRARRRSRSPRAERIATASPYVLALGKRAFYAQDQLPEADAYDIAAPVMVDNAQADDAQEGMRAFLEKRAPQWRNR